MKEVTITIKRDDVYEEVAKTTAYTGSRLDENEKKRVFTTEDDRTMLERFWQEAKDLMCTNMRRVLTEVTDTNGTLTLKLSLSDAYNVALTDSIASSMSSYFVTSITAKWFAVMNIPDVTTYANEAAALAEDVLRKVLFKKKPVRRTTTP